MLHLLLKKNLQYYSYNIDTKSILDIPVIVIRAYKHVIHVHCYYHFCMCLYNFFLLHSCVSCFSCFHVATTCDQRQSGMAVVIGHDHMVVYINMDYQP